MEFAFVVIRFPLITKQTRDHIDKEKKKRKKKRKKKKELPLPVTENEKLGN